MWTRKGLKSRARIAFRGSYWAAVAVCFVLAFVAGEFAESTQLIHKRQDAQSNFTVVQDRVGDGELWNIHTDEDATALDRTVSNVFNALTSGQEWLFKLMAGGLFTLGAGLMLLFQFFVAAPLQVGARRFFLAAGERRAEAFEMGNPFRRGNYLNTVRVMFLRYLYTALWCLLFLVPGIVKAYEYRMIPFLLAEDPRMDHRAAFRASRDMMRGNKWRAFVLDLSFLGWRFLSAITFGLVGIFYANPYEVATDAQLYRALRMGGGTLFG